MPDCSAGGLLADQAVLPLNIYRVSTSAAVSHEDAATETHGDRNTDSVVVEFHPAEWNRQRQKSVPTEGRGCGQKCRHLYWVRNGRLDHCPRYKDTRSIQEGLLARKRIRRWQWTEGRLPRGEVSVRLDISGATGDRQNRRLEIRRVRRRSQVGR